MFEDVFLCFGHSYTHNLDFIGAGDWQCQQLGHMQIYTTNHASTPPLSFLQAGCPSCRPTNSVKALKAQVLVTVN